MMIRSPKFAQTLWSVCVVMIVGGCASGAGFSNKERPRSAADAPAYSALVTVPKPTAIQICTDSAVPLELCEKHHLRNANGLIAIAISGGGSRAANFASAVMQELQAMGIMQHVSVLSSVSGGSVAAAYYKVHQQELANAASASEAWKTAKAKLSEQIRSLWVRKLLRPDNFAATMIGATGRTQFLADVFDTTLFGGQGTTFGDLPASPPALLINATLVNELSHRPAGACTNRRELSPWTRWESVSFRDEFFNKCLNSRLDTYPLSLAVAASAAFPGVFSSVTLARFDRQYRYDQSYLRTIPSEFVHLIDGGPSENLGIESLLGEHAADHSVAASVNQTNNIGERWQKCLIISIDAFARGATDARNLRADPRSVFDRIVDSNFVDATDALLARRRFDTLQRLGLAPPQFVNTNRLHQLPNFPNYGQTFELSAYDHVAENVTLQQALGEQTANVLHPGCTVWHVGLDNLKSHLLATWRFRDHGVGDVSYDDYQRELREMVESQSGAHLVAVAELASRVRTDFDLVGPASCSPKQLSEVLWEAGRLAVAADQPSRMKVCDWFANAGLQVAATCAAPKPVVDGLQIKAEFSSPTGFYDVYDVGCAPLDQK